MDQEQPPKGRSPVPSLPRSKGKLDQKVHDEIYTRIQDLPTSVDWRDEGIISPVKNQGNLTF